MFDHLSESSHGDDSLKWSNEGITQVESIEVNFMHLILCSGKCQINFLLTVALTIQYTGGSSKDSEKVSDFRYCNSIATAPYKTITM